MAVKNTQGEKVTRVGNVLKIIGLIAAVAIPIIAILTIYIRFFYFQPKIIYEVFDEDDVIRLLPEEYKKAFVKAIKEEGRVIRIRNEGHKEAETVRLIFDSSNYINRPGKDLYYEEKYGEHYINVYDVTIDSLIRYKRVNNAENHRLEIDFETIPEDIVITVKYKELINCEPKVIYEKGEAKIIKFGASEQGLDELPFMIVLVIALIFTTITLIRNLVGTKEQKELLEVMEKMRKLIKESKGQT